MCLCYGPDFLLDISVVLVKENNPNQILLMRIKQLYVFLLTFPIWSI